MIAIILIAGFLGYSAAPPVTGPAAGIAPAQGVEYTLTTLDAEPFAATATLTIMADGGVAGAAPCNRWNGTLTGEWPDFTLGPVISTRATCPDQAAEYAFLRAMQAVTLGRTEGDRLFLYAPDGTRLGFVVAR